MNGLQALQIIKDTPDTATIPVMMYTSKEDRMYVSQARALGAIDILPKQLKPVELKNVLQKMHLVPLAENDDVVEEPDGEALTLRKQAQAQAAQTEQEELSKLVKDAEAALEKETLKQFMHLELERTISALRQHY